MKQLLVLIAAILAGCAAPKEWYRSGATEQDFYMDGGQCRAQAAGASPYMVPMQIAIVYSNCMQGKGWYLQDAPKRK